MVSPSSVRSPSPVQESVPADSRGCQSNITVSTPVPRGNYNSGYNNDHCETNHTLSPPNTILRSGKILVPPTSSNSDTTTCVYCSRSFASSWGLSVHMRSCRNLKVFDSPNPVSPTRALFTDPQPPGGISCEDTTVCSSPLRPHSKKSVNTLASPDNLPLLGHALLRVEKQTLCHTLDPSLLSSGPECATRRHTLTTGTRCSTTFPKSGSSLFRS